MTTTERAFTYGSTFSGIGGLDLGLERAGMHTAWQAEADAYCRAILAHRFGAPCYTDVRHVGADPADAPASGLCAPRSIDLLCGGFPCQDLSTGGRRAGLAGARSGLFHEFARIAGAVRPRWLLVENVPGLLTSNGGRDLGVVLGTLAEIGYSCAWRVLDSRYFGVPQRRRRVFIVGHFGVDAGPALHALCESCGGHIAASGSTWQTPAARARARAAHDGGPVRYWVEDGENGTLRANGEGGSPPRTDKQPLVLVAPAVAGTLTVKSAGNKGSAPDEATYVLQPNDTPDAPGALTASRIDTAPALDTTAERKTTDRGVRVAMADGVRRLTPRECERLQSLPDDWTTAPGVECPDGRRYGAIGNAVTANVAEWIGRRILAVDATIERTP